MFLAAVDPTSDPACLDCGSAAKPVPGPSYVAEDGELFDQLWQALSEAALPAAEAARLRELLEEPLLADTTDLQRLKRLADVLPSLTLIDAMIDASEPALRKAEGMLTTMLDALSRRR